MKQEIVLPKFKVPGQTNWLVRGLWIAGGVVLVQAVVVALVLSHRQNEQARQALEQQRAQDAQRLAAVEAAVAAAAQRAREARAVAAARAAALRPPAPAPKAPGATLASTAPTKAHGRVGYTARKKPARLGKFVATKGTRGVHRGAGRGRRPGAGAGAGPQAAVRGTPKGKGARGGDAIDDILRKFK